MPCTSTGYVLFYTIAAGAIRFIYSIVSSISFLARQLLTWMARFSLFSFRIAITPLIICSSPAPPLILAMISSLFYLPIVLVCASSGIRTIIRFSSFRLAIGACAGWPFLLWYISIIPLLATCAYVAFPLIISSYFSNFSAAASNRLVAASTRLNASVTRS
jgi:hypothetical protein